LLVANGTDFFSEEKRYSRHEVEPPAQGVPGYRVTNTCLQGRYRIEKVIVADTERDALIQQVGFTPLYGSIGDYGLYALRAPHI
jgi:glucoamylase